jgi:hypothetical protein
MFHIPQGRGTRLIGAKKNHPITVTSENSVIRTQNQLVHVTEAHRLATGLKTIIR